MPFKRVCVLGLGYIGLPTAAILASRGLDIIGVDIARETVDTINSGRVHIVEPDLDIIVRSAVATGKLRATCTPEAADVFIIAVPTPLKDKHEPDLSFIRSATAAIAPLLEKGNLVILESTSPVGTTEKVAAWLKQQRPELDFPQDAGDRADINIAHCPERVLPGSVLQEMVANDRIIGGLSPVCAQRAGALYQLFVKGECRLTRARVAELAKLTENAFRDVNIAFANELSMICDKLGINVWELIALANRHPRVNILQPGPGVGGHCIAVDPWFIVDSAPEQSALVQTARAVNNKKPRHVLAQIQQAADQFKNPIIACLGLSFKADIDDMRESPALWITRQLAAAGTATILVVEPHIDELPGELSDRDVHLVSLQQALEQANTIALLVNHKAFHLIDQSRLHTKAVVDTRGIV